MSLSGLVLTVFAGVFVGICIATADEAEATSYLSNDPKACVNCHIMRDEYEGWQHAPHHAVATCNDCHVPHDFLGRYLTKIEHGYRHSKAFTLQDFHEPIRMTASSARVVENNCLRCHAEFVSEITAGHGYQAGNDLAEVDCIRCHARVGHGAMR